MPHIKTNVCIHCGQPGSLEITEQELDALNRYRGLHPIQSLLPNRSTNYREQIMTGIHCGEQGNRNCWDEIFADEED